MFVDESFSLPDLAQDLFETMPLGVVYQEANGKIVAANPAALHILGLTLDQVLGRTSLDPRWRAIHEDGSDFPGDEHPSMQALHSGQVVRDVIMGIYNPQIKAYHWINITAIPLFKNANELPYMALTTFENITARVKAEAALSESEGLWKFAVEGFGDGLWDWSPQSGQVYYSPQWKAMLGYASDEIGSSADEWSTRIHPDDRERILAGTANLLSRKIPVYTDEYRLRCRDGSYKWIFDRAQVIRWAADGKPLRVLGTHSDITARREMENRLRENEERYRALYEYSPISIWEEDFSALATEIRRLQGEGVTDLRAYLEQYPQTVREMASLIRIIDINQATVDFFERNNKAELNRDLTSYFTEESLLAFRKEIVAIAEGKTSFQYEIPIRGANDRRRLLLLSLVVTPGYETTYERVLVSFIDITEQRQAEQEIRQHNRELEINREILTSLAGHFTLEAILARIVKGALELTGLEGSLLYICDEQQQLRLAACQNIPGDLQEAIQRGPLHLADDPGGSIKEALFWPAIEAKPPSSAADCGVEHNNNPAIQAAGIQFYAALPLSMKGRLISLLCIFTLYSSVNPDRPGSHKTWCILMYPP